eukprot:13395536-Alexandrium_andersonii.AAC.1
MGRRALCTQGGSSVGQARTQRRRLAKGDTSILGHVNGPPGHMLGRARHSTQPFLARGDPAVHGGLREGSVASSRHAPAPCRLA